MPAASIKICGIRSLEQLRPILHLPIDHIGFVFAPSKRRVTAEEAAPMVALLREQAVALSVGVFVNPTMEELRHVMRIAPLDVIQLNGQEGAAFCAEIKEAFGVRLFKALPIAPAEAVEESSPEAAAAEADNLLAPYAGIVDAILLDTYDPVVGGGTGHAFAWERIPPYLKRANELGMKLLVAGGLHPDNVGGLVAEYKPDGVDVSSGVETDGVKDTNKIIAFVERVKST